MNLTFPKDFFWGTATSAYQIEGAARADGKGESIWDRFSHTPGKTRNGETGDVALDHYHRYLRDIEIMRQIGINAYRFSVAWTRILPTGRGPVNQKGLDFYQRLVDALIAAGITPFLTLYHWDLPQALQNEGGWEARSTSEAFADYAEVLAQALGDRVKHWITHNEPAVATLVGHYEGRHAPGKQDLSAALRASHHILLSHGLAVPRLRAHSPDSEIGITLDLNYHQPASSSFADLRAARLENGRWGSWFLDPVLGRRYPADIEAHYVQEGGLPEEGMQAIRQPGDMEAIAAPIDFIGLNYYRRHLARSDAPDNAPQTVFQAPKTPETWTEMNWEIYPEGLYHALARLHYEYQVPKIYITENGASFSDGPDREGRIRDVRRIDYHQRHLQVAHRAIENGVPLAGYFAWSLCDNFEWAEGYAQRFGLVWVDFDTQERILKDSALWYRSVIQANGLPMAAS